LRIALAIYRLHPRGGLEDNCIRIADELVRRGHSVQLLCAEDAPGAPHPVAILPSAAGRRTNHTRMAAFAADVSAHARGRFEATVAFHPMSGTDFVFWGDTLRCRDDLSFWKRMLPRYRIYGQLEADCFSPANPVRVIGLSSEQKSQIARLHATPDACIRIAGPTLSRRKYRPEVRQSDAGSQLRATLNIPADAHVWLWLGLCARSKGLDRVIDALARSRNTVLLVGGLSADSHATLSVCRRIRRSGQEENVRFLGYLAPDSVVEAMAASEVLAHPARVDTTGAVILESIVNGLPVVATGICGFSEHVRNSGAGHVLEDGFDPESFLSRLQAVCADREGTLSRKAIAYGRSQNLFDGLSDVCDWIEENPWRMAASRVTEISGAASASPYEDGKSDQTSLSRSRKSSVAS